jgi:ketosteroid isomerase-like protein
MTDEILHVHHFHKRRIHCFDANPPKEEDLPFILSCCHCNFEKEITEINPQYLTGEEGKKKFLEHVHAKQKLYKEEMKREFEGADATLRAYHERKKRKAENNA